MLAVRRTLTMTVLGGVLVRRSVRGFLMGAAIVAGAVLVHGRLAISACDLDATPVNLCTSQGCEIDGTYYPAFGRLCQYLDGDTMAQWERWWMDARPVTKAPARSPSRAVPTASGR